MSLGARCILAQNGRIGTYAQPCLVQFDVTIAAARRLGAFARYQFEVRMTEETGVSLQRRGRCAVEQAAKRNARMLPAYIPKCNIQPREREYDWPAAPQPSSASTRTSSISITVRGRPAKNKGSSV